MLVLATSSNFLQLAEMPYKQTTKKASVTK